MRRVEGTLRRFALAFAAALMIVGMLAALAWADDMVVPLGPITPSYETYESIFKLVAA
jgi:hypothetical protein